MKRICIITNIPSPYRVDLFKYLQDNMKDYEIHIIFSSNNEDNRKWNTGYNKLSNIHFLKSKTIKIRKSLDYKYIHIPFDFINNIKTINPDVVIASEYNITSILAKIWCRKSKKKYISWSDGTLNSEKNINLLQKISRKIICKKSDALIASSTKTKEAQISYGANKSNIFMSYLTVDIEKLKYDKRSKIGRRLLYVGTLVKRKGLDLLFKALERVTEEYELIIVGEGSERKNLEQLACDLNIGQKIKFLGNKNQEELRDIYKECDIFLLPSREDCFGLVLLEAMCNSMLIISSKFADGSYDIIENNVSGFIVNPFDTDNYAKVINNSLGNNQLSLKMALKVYQNNEKFSFENVSRGFKDSVKFVCDENGKKSNK